MFTGCYATKVRMLPSRDLYNRSWNIQLRSQLYEITCANSARLRSNFKSDFRHKRKPKHVNDMLQKIGWHPKITISRNVLRAGLYSMDWIWYKLKFNIEGPFRNEVKERSKKSVQRRRLCNWFETVTHGGIGISAFSTHRFSLCGIYFNLNTLLVSKTTNLVSCGKFLWISSSEKVFGWKKMCKQFLLDISLKREKSLRFKVLFSGKVAWMVNASFLQGNIFLISARSSHKIFMSFCCVHYGLSDTTSKIWRRKPCGQFLLCTFEIR